MRIKNLLFVGLIALGLASCSNDDNLPGDGGNGAAVKGYITLNITNPKEQPSLYAGTSRTVGENTQVGTDVENAIKKVRVILADADGKVKTSFETEQFVDGEKRVTKPQEVELGTYFVYAIVNPAGGVVATEGESIQQVIKNVTEEAAKAGFSKGDFMMMNANEEVDKLGGIEVEVKATNTEANPAKAVVPVDRIAVKVVSNTLGDISDKIKEESDAANLLTDLEVKGFVLINGNTQFNLIQSWEKLANGSVVLTTPSEVGNYYNPMVDYGVVKVEDGKTTLTDLTLGKEDVFGSDAVYTLENRPEFLYTQNLNELTSGMAVTTGVIYHMVANGGETFFVYKGKAYTDVEVLAKHADFAVYEEETGKVIEGQSTIDGVKANFPALRGHGVQVYENGNMYYTYFIEDQNYTMLNEQTSESTKYNAVMRNAVYNLSVKSITELGDDIPGGGVIDPENPNPPIKTDKAYIQVEVTVRPWVLNDIEIEF